MHQKIFISQIYPGRSISRTLLLLTSLREFGGKQADCPVWIFYPEILGDPGEKESIRLRELGAEIIPCDGEQDVLSFPFGAKVQAAATAEKLAAGKTELVIWLDEDTLILAEPDEFRLPSGISLGYRPVHHKLLGISWDQEPDPFWRLIYQYCQASPEDDFPMVTHVGEKIHPYFNAGVFVVRPELGILKQWWKVFEECFRAAPFQPFYEKNELYAVFLHQALFTGILINLLDRGEMQLLNPAINYPLHLHHDIPPDLRAKRIDDLVTVRYENSFSDPDWQQNFPISQELKGWIRDQLQHCQFQGV